ncbi:MAG: DUF3486 family protein [Deltaproteobacteria bacterium]|jgi:hypothetical protein|nr:DUF3486 family protein [Deltaproteobacteria bacterium]
MGRPSSVKRLPPEVRECIGRLREQGRTLDEILEHLGTLDAELGLSRSALGRYTKQIDRIAAEMEQSRVMAEALVREQRGQSAGTTARLNMQLMHTAMYRLLSHSLGGDEQGQEPVTFTPQETVLLFKALEHASRASKTDAEYTAKIREEARREVEKEVRAKVDELCLADNLSNEDLKKRITDLVAGE